jgi:ADP-heptose:LPS heptosyltransferase
MAPWTGKLWNPANWHELISVLKQNGWDVEGLCGPGQTAQAQNQLGPQTQITECLNIQRWADRLGRCAAAITVDSGPMHLADAVGVPVIALFGQGKLPLWAPSGSSSRIIHHQDDPDFFLCHPIEENAALGRKFMERITVGEVLAAVEALPRPCQ